MRWNEGIIIKVIEAEKDKLMDIFEIIYKDNNNYYRKHLHQTSTLLVPAKHLKLNSVDFVTEVTRPDVVDIYSKNMLLQVHTLTNIFSRPIKINFMYIFIITIHETGMVETK